MQIGSLAASPRVVLLTASTVLNATAIKTSIATAAAAASYSGAALNGGDVDGVTHIATPTASGYTNIAQYPIAVASNSAGSYVASSKIMFTGTYGTGYGSQNVVRTATVVGTGGNATFVADGPLDTVSQIDVEAQVNTSGAWTFGFNDVACRKNAGELEPWRWLQATSTGDCLVTCAVGGDALLAGLTAASPKENVDITRVKFSDASTTVTTIRLYE